MFRKFLFIIFFITYPLFSQNIIPLPASVQRQNSSLDFKNISGIVVSDSRLKNETDFLKNIIHAVTGKDATISEKATELTGLIILDLSNPEIKRDESYKLEVNSNFIRISADKPVGIFYGIQTLRQMLPSGAEINKSEADNTKINCCTINDSPRFIWRGMLLDCCRHFFPKEFIKRYLDILAYYKMNRFHWHLTEDQGWRIEIKKYPELTKKGAWRKEKDGSLYGGFYTQEDIREIVAYAGKLHITVIPEIEMPGHSLAALSSYPEISCTGGPFEVTPEWGVFKDVYCAGNEKTFEFLENVLKEVMLLFPSQYIHIGGDEVPKYNWEKCTKCQNRIKEEKLKDENELQSYFIKRIEKFLTRNNKKLIGWDEILEGGLAPEATVQSWRGFEGALDAVNSGHDAIVSPTSHAYFDYSIATTDLKKVYGFEPVPTGIKPEDTKHILGGECNMWTERATAENIDSKVFPRLLAMSEALWTPSERKNYTDFLPRVHEHYKKLDYFGIKYGYEAVPVKFIGNYDITSNSFNVILEPGQSGIRLLYSIDENKQDIPFTSAIRIDKTTEIKVKIERNGAADNNVYSRKFSIHNAIGKRISIKNPYSPKYASSGDGALTDGLRGSLDFHDKLWQGYLKEDMDVIIDLESVRDIHAISTGFLSSVPSWIFFPLSVEFSASQDGQIFETITNINGETPKNITENIIKDFKWSGKVIQARYIRVSAKNIGLCPAWHDGAGGKAWIFADEIEIN